MTYVLVHGGGSTGRFWDRLLPHLDRPALAVDLPGRAGNPPDLATRSAAEGAESGGADSEGGNRAREAGPRAGGATPPPAPPEDTERFRRASAGEPLDNDTLAFVVDPVRCVE